MKYDDLEHTQELFDFTASVPSVIETIDMEGVSKEKLESSEEEKEEPVEMLLDDKKTKKKKKEKKEKKNNKKKIVFIIIGIILVILIALILIYFLILKKEEPKEEEKIEEPEVIVEKENYIYRNGELVFLDEEEQEIGTYECTNKDENLCYVAFYSLEDQFNTEKNVYENNKEIERRSTIYANQYVFIYDNKEEADGNIIIYDLETKESSGRYSLIKGFNDSTYVVAKNSVGKYGVLEITKDGIVEKLAFSFEYVGMMNKDAMLVVKANDKYYIYDKEGKVKSKGVSSYIKSYNEKYFITQEDGHYQAYDMNGNLLFRDTYDFIELKDNFAVLIEDNILTISGYKNEKYMEEGIELGSSDYVVVNVYDEDKKKISTKEAYHLEITENEVTIYYTVKKKEKTKTINLKEAEISANTKYINYFDGKLYFYKDEAKTNLLGVYTCENKNTLQLKNCTVATDTFYSLNSFTSDESSNVGWIPIFNQRFVFIYDSSDEEQPLIVLYDLKNNKTITSYVSVDSGSYTKSSEVSFKTTGGTYIMAKSAKSSKYGLIRIGEEVNTVIGFNCEAIEIFKDYYLIEDEGHTYALMDQKGTLITSKLGYKIIDYKDKYLIVQNEKGKYLVFNFEGEKLSQEAYDYIALEQDYYVAINNQELDIKKYDNKDFKLSQTVNLNTTNYEGSYLIKKTSSGYTVQIVATKETFAYTTNGNLITDEE